MQVKNQGNNEADDAGNEKKLSNIGGEVNESKTRKNSA